MFFLILFVLSYGLECKDDEVEFYPIEGDPYCSTVPKDDGFNNHYECSVDLNDCYFEIDENECTKIKPLCDGEYFTEVISSNSKLYWCPFENPSCDIEYNLGCSEIDPKHCKITCKKDYVKQCSNEKCISTPKDDNLNENYECTFDSKKFEAKEGKCTKVDNDYLIIDKQDSKYYSCYYKDSDCKEISCCNELNEKQKCQVKKEESSENGIESISILLIVALFMIF